MKKKRKPNRSPAGVLADRLAELRRAGVGFEAAWTYALADAKRAANSLGNESRLEWVATLEECRSEFRAAFERRSTPFSAALAERETLADGIADFVCGTQPVAA
ncbi:MAG: hypothetical protein R2725_07635 [Solirubrobacterales bacterium]